LQLLQDKCLYIQQSIDDARAASNNDTKSSMGDKYETTREMMQIEINKLGLQLYEAQQMLLSLKTTDPYQKSDSVQMGGLVKTEKMVFYLCAGLGKINLENETYFVISPGSPMGKMMLNKKVNDAFEVNGVKYLMKEII